MASELDLAAPALQPGVGVLRPQRGGGRALARGGGLRGPEGVMNRLELLTNLREDSKCPELRVSLNFIPKQLARRGPRGPGQRRVEIIWRKRGFQWNRSNSGKIVAFNKYQVAFMTRNAF